MAVDLVARCRCRLGGRQPETLVGKRIAYTKYGCSKIRHGTVISWSHPYLHVQPDGWFARAVYAVRSALS